MILGGLNEGVWPGLPAPEPWLAPRIRFGGDHEPASGIDRSAGGAPD